MRAAELRGSLPGVKGSMDSRQLRGQQRPLWEKVTLDRGCDYLVTLGLFCPGYKLPSSVPWYLEGSSG